MRRSPSARVPRTMTPGSAHRLGLSEPGIPTESASPKALETLDSASHLADAVDDALASVGVFFPATKNTQPEILFVVALAVVLVRLLGTAVPPRTTRVAHMARRCKLWAVNRLALSCDVAVVVLRIEIAQNAVVVPEVVDVRIV